MSSIAAGIMIPLLVPFAYYYSPDRKSAHPADHLADFSGVIHADGYDGCRRHCGNQFARLLAWRCAPQVP